MKGPENQSTFQESREAFLSKRDEYTVEIRKKKTNDIINKKRFRNNLTGKFTSEEKAQFPDISGYGDEEVDYFLEIPCLILAISSYHSISKSFLVRISVPAAWKALRN
mgnify:CR=1 FL=1